MIDIPNFDLPNIDPQDIAQEVALLRLEGIEHPSAQLIRRRLERSELIFDLAPENAAPLWQDPEPDLFVTEELVKYALNQSEEMAERLFEFLEEPTHEGVDSILSFLQEQGVHLHPDKRYRAAKSITHMILNALPANIEDLYDLVRTVQFTERPEATVRQILRRLVRSGAVEQHQSLYRRKNG